MKNGVPDLKYTQKVQIHNYYVSLRQFFEMTGGSHDRSMSSRAQKARSKLLKLSPSQFFELSTDVSDELQRRIDESQPHEFLAPNESFHAKRNQARQKLANLSNVRFTDLVDDILFEIRRRNYDSLPELSEADYEESPQVGTRASLDNAAEFASPALHAVDTKPSPVLTNGFSDKSAEEEEVPHDENLALNTTLQTSTVIPKTASIDWSSDEEEDKPKVEEEKEVEDAANNDLNEPVVDDVVTVQRSSSLNKSPIIIADETQSPVIPATASPVRSMSPISIDNHFTFSDRPLSQSSGAKTPIAQTAATTVGLAGAGLSPLASNGKRLGSFSNSLKRNKDRDIELLLSEGNKLDNTITQLEREKSQLLDKLNDLQNSNEELEAKNELLSEEVQHLKSKTNESSTTKALDSNFQKGMSELTTQLNELSIENEELKQQKLELQLQLRNIQSPVKVSDARSSRDVAYWKSKYEASVIDNPARSISTSIAPITDEHLFPNNSIIPSNLIDDLDSKLSKLLNSVVSHDSTALSLFQNIASISEDCSKILTLVHSPDTNTMRLVLENVVSHGITAVRYFITYRTPLLRVILENAVSEISYAIYDLVRTVNVDSSSVTSATTNKNIEKLEYPLGSPEQNGPAYTGFDSNPNPKLSIEKPSYISSHSDSVEMSPVKPLKITQKKSTEDATSRPDSKRKPSGTGLFTAMLNGGLKKDPNSKNPKNKLQLELPFGDNLKFGSSAPKVERRELKKVDTNSSASSEQPQQASPLATKSSSTVPSDFYPPTSFEPTSPDKVNLLQNINSDMYKSNDEDTGSESADGIDDDDDDDNSTYEVLRKSMKHNHQSEENGKPNEPTSRGIFSPVIHPQPIEVTVDDDDLSEKPFNFESEDTSQLEPEAVHSIAVNKRDVKLLPVVDNTPVVNNMPVVDKTSVDNNTPVLKHNEPSPSPSPGLVVSPFKPTATDALAFGSSKAGTDKKSINSTQEEPVIKQDVKEQEYDESDEDIEFDVDAFDTENPDNSLSDLLLYLEYQTMDVINTIQSLLSSIKLPKSTAGELRTESNAINQVIRQMVEATSVSMNQSRNSQLKEHGSWVVQSLDDCRRRMTILCHLKPDGIVAEYEGDDEFADKHFKQRLAGIAFDVAKCTKELVKTVEEASLKTNIEYLNAKLSK